MKKRITRAALLAGLGLAAISGPEPAWCAPVVVAVVRDGPSNDDRLLPLIESVLVEIGRGETELVLRSLPQFDAGWDGALVPTVIRDALTDRQVYIILGLGAMVTLEADAKKTKAQLIEEDPIPACDWC